ncbi:MAG: hypothetical protein COB04_02855 [Gammaproteobacteria bacterium]|nr:MAG: hypothetical protein COB04_02855 [Gammaproteobacteria bacterium]
MKLKRLIFLVIGLQGYVGSASAENYHCYVFCTDNQHHIAYIGAQSLRDAAADARQSQIANFEGRIVDVLQVKECKTEHEKFQSAEATAVLKREPG